MPFRLKHQTFGVLLFLAAVLRLGLAFERARIPFQLDYEEGNVLNAALRIARGSTPYPPPGSFPYVMNPYGPFGYSIAAACVKLFGVSLLAPRLLVLLASAAVAVLIFLVSRFYRVSREIAVSVAVLFFCSPSMWAWASVLRVDLWAVLLSLAGLYVFARKSDHWPISAVLFALALLTKPTAIVAAAACLVELLAERKIARAVQFCSLTGVIVLAGIPVLGGTPLFHLLRTHADPFSFTHLVNWYVAGLGQSTVLLAVAIYALAFGFRWSQQTRLLWNYCGLCFVVAAITASKIGSDMNHFIELGVGISVFSALSMQFLTEKRDPLAKPFLVAITGVAVVLGFLPQSAYRHKPERAGCGEAYAYVRSFPGNRLLSEDVSALVLAGKPVLISNPFVVTQLGNSVNWSEGSIDQLSSQEYFDAIFLAGRGEGRWSPTFWRATAAHYDISREFDCSSLKAVLLPKSRTASEHDVRGEPRSAGGTSAGTESHIRSVER